MPTRRQLLLSAAFAIALTASGCSGTQSRDADIDRAEARWKAAKPGKYRYELRKAGFLLPNRVRVTVDDATGSIVEVLEGDEPSDFLKWDSIDALFATAREIRGNGGTATFTYGGSDSVPETLVTDPLPGAVDDEVTYVVERFTIL